ncbi:MAG: DUF3883 domain-containing protein [Capsulimonadales bacterium]|nr:DUF3883 domain-containing protein [Capsulimonadales bacterium]
MSNQEEKNVPVSGSPMDEDHRRALIVAYFLSRFDRKGYRALGFNTFKEAFQKIGDLLRVKPATIKNMRDEFDPFCSVIRVGWYQRPVIRSRMIVMQAFDSLSESAMFEIVKTVLDGEAKEVAVYTSPIAAIPKDQSVSESENNAYANRLKTGVAAEKHFMERFPHLTLFKGSSLEDTRMFGIGFDFRANYPTEYRAIEVKGVSERNGLISFTDKEWSVARELNDRYVLALVRSVNSKPELELVIDPVSSIEVTMKAVESVAVRWNAKV